MEIPSSYAKVWEGNGQTTQQAWPCLRCVITLPAGLVTSYFSHVHLHPPLVILHRSNSNTHPRHQLLWDPLQVCRRVVPPCFTPFDNILIPTLPNTKRVVVYFYYDFWEVLASSLCLNVGLSWWHTNRHKDISTYSISADKASFMKLLPCHTVQVGSTPIRNKSSP